MTRELIKRNFGAIWPQHVMNLVDHLIACRKTLGDMDVLLILAVIGDRNLSDRNTDKSLTFAQLFENGAARPSREDINVQCIADYTGIPRETVRRKTQDLIERGWVMRTEKGYLAVTAKCREDLAATTEHGVDYLANMFEMFAALK